MPFQKLPPRLHPGRVHLRGYAWNEWQSKQIPAGTTPEDMLNPDYWAHYAQDLKPNDMIHLKCEDGTWEGIFSVRFVSRQEVKMVPFQVKVYDLDDEQNLESETHVIKWISPPKRYGVFVKSSGQCIKDDLYPREKAVEFLEKHLRSLAA